MKDSLKNLTLTGNIQDGWSKTRSILSNDILGMDGRVGKMININLPNVAYS